MTGPLPVTSGLVGWYKGEEWNGTSWPDSSGNGNNVTSIYGNVESQGRFIYGRTNDYMVFPSAILPSTYTLFHIAKYNGPKKERIFCSNDSVNWLSGFHGGKSGVAYHDVNDWVTQSASTSFPLSDVLISTDQKALYRGNGTNLVVNASGVSCNLRINGQYGEWSDWAVAEVIVYNRELSLSEIQQVEAYLNVRNGEIDSASIQSHLGGSNPVYLSEYYGTSGYVPSSGTLSFNNFRRLSQVPLIGIPPKNLQVYLDAADSRSYPGTGTTWYDISGNGRNGTWTSVNYQTDNEMSYFEANEQVCSGPASNSFGIDNTSGYTVFIIFNQNSIIQSHSFKFYSSASYSRGIFTHCTWENGNIYFDQGGCCNTDTRLVGSGTPLPNATGSWHSVAFVRETGSSTRHLYIDGSSVATSTAAAANINLNSTAVNYIGDASVDTNKRWDAKVKCFLAYNRHLTSGEISALHNTLII